MSHQIDFKGTKNGIILRYDSSLNYNQFIAALTTKLTAANQFFAGSHIIGLEGPTFDRQQEVEISRLFQDLGGMKVLSLEQVSHIQRPVSRHANADADCASTSRFATHKRVDSVADELSVGSEVLGETVDDRTIVHRGTLRSGSRLEADGHLVLLGDANPGSELSAAGHIIVMGALRGFAHAGKHGDSNRFIVALKLQPTQLRIGNHITRPPDDGEGPGYPEIALVKQDKIIIEPYHR